jgi:Domain of unknown function (DUF1981)
MEGSLEQLLLASLDSLYSEDRELDVRMGLLRVLLNVLQRHGERLSIGWQPVLHLLTRVPDREEVETIGLGFQSVQLMCSDFMSSLPGHHLQHCLEVAALYASQQV